MDERRITRRGALAAGAGALLAPGVARGAARRSAGVFEVNVGRLRAGIPVTVPLPRPVALAAVRWRSPASARIELRTSRDRPWVSASGGGHDGDGVRSAGPVGEGVWTGATRAVRLHSDATVDGVALECVAASWVSGPSLVGDAPPLAGPSLPAGPGQPPIVARAAWAGSSHPPVGGPFYGSVEMGIVHHTESADDYAPGDVPAMIRSIYEFHVHGRGWFDIGYNFVVDRFGRIWEARQGGIDLPVMGAQAGDWNQVSSGVAVLGTFEDGLPPLATLRALEHLLAWKLALSGVPAVGSIELVVPGAAVSYTQFRAGERVRLPRIAGHREVDSTDCPGDALAAVLPGVRDATARLAGAPATLSVAAELSAGVGGAATVTLSGVLRAGGGSGVAAAPVAVQEIVGRMGATRTLATATTAADGSWSASLPARPGQLLRALHAPRPAVTADLVAVDRSMPSGV